MNESSTDAFAERRKNLEDAFFKDRDQHLLKKMRTELETLEETKKLSHVSGIVDERVLKSLVQAGVRAETLAAVTLIPLIEVAWCDGTVTVEERDAVLNAGAKAGIHPDKAPYDLLRQWLENRPDARTFVAWKDYITEVSSLMPKDSLTEFKRSMVDRCTRVAEAAGGFLGLATISAKERAKIDEFGKAFGE
jgi:hypothetical protein